MTYFLLEGPSSMSYRSNRKLSQSVGASGSKSAIVLVRSFKIIQKNRLGTNNAINININIQYGGKVINLFRKRWIRSQQRIINNCSFIIIE
jgi:hypothetical protein